MYVYWLLDPHCLCCESQLSLQLLGGAMDAPGSLFCIKAASEGLVGSDRVGGALESLASFSF